MGSVGTEHLPLFGDSAPGPSARTRGLEGLDRAVRTHAQELDRCVQIARELAGADAGRGITVEDVRRVAGLLHSKGRQLAFLGAVMQKAGLQRTKEYRRSEIPSSHGNLNVVWRSGR